jgi:hypothetical protein
MPVALFCQRSTNFWKKRGYTYGAHCNILKYIILKEKVGKFYCKCPKIAAKSAAPILLTAPSINTIFDPP